MAMAQDIARPFALGGRVAVVTGAGSGLGREAARIFAGAGAASVVLADVDEPGMEETAALVRDAGASALIRRTNMALRDEVEALATMAQDSCGRIDIWVNSAGISIWDKLVDTPSAGAERVIAVNLMGPLWACAAAGRIMQQQGGGSIVNLSSTAGSRPVPGLGVYGMAKAGVEQLTRVAALEMGAGGVRVIAIAPGWIDTPINSSQYRDASGAIDPQMREQVLGAMAALSPLGMTGVPSDIGNALLYLASDASRFVTGQVLRVSGGV